MAKRLSAEQLDTLGGLLSGQELASVDNDTLLALVSMARTSIEQADQLNHVLKLIESVNCGCGTALTMGDVPRDAVCWRCDYLLKYGDK